MKCDYCEIIDENRDVIYQDSDLVVAIKDGGLVPGQVTVFPRKHVTILEMIPDEILKKCSLMANKVGIAIFEGIACQGTNILIQNGVGGGQKVPHFAIEIIPRNENDGLQLQWQPQQLMEEEMDAAYNTLQAELQKPAAPPPAEETETAPKEKTPEKENQGKSYLLKSLQRLP